MTRRDYNAMHYCRRCLNDFTSKEAISNHDEYCSQHDTQKIVIPEAGMGKNLLYFKNTNRKKRVPFKIYADFESVIKHINSSQPNPSESYTNQNQKHIHSSFCY